MPGFFIHTSNRMEALVDALVDAVLKQPLADPFRPETVVVNSRGMETWLQQQIALRRGITANINFPFLNTFVDGILAGQLGDDDCDPTVLSRGRSVWTIFDILLRKETAENTIFAPLINYLDNGPDRQFKAMQLSLRLADLIDQYQVYRPLMLKDWREKSSVPQNLKPPDQWQSVLFRMMLQESGAYSRDQCFQLLFEHASETLPAEHERLSIFGVSSMPPVYLQLFSLFSTAIPVHLFLFNPCSEEWTYDLSPQRKLRASERLLRQGVSVEEQYLDVGHPLLSSWGMLGQEFVSEVIEQVNPTEWNDDFRTTEGANLLQNLQNEIITRFPVTESRKKKQFEASDQSLQVQICHGPRREIEVLKDYLLQIFIDTPDLSPHQVMVMAPDISEYVPYIDTVFAASNADHPQALPYTIADRSRGQESRLIDAFLNLLQVHHSRFKATEILDLLSVEAVAAARGLNQTDLDLIRKWIAQAGIHWGVDEEQRSELTGYKFDEGSWRFGLRRLLLGYAMQPTAEQVNGGLFTIAEDVKILPYADLDPADAVILGEFAAFVKDLFELQQQLKHSRTVEDWKVLLLELLNRVFVSNNETYKDIRFLTQALDTMVENATSAKCERLLDAETVRYWLRQAIDDEKASGGFMRGGITFCSLLPMRSIPAEVVYLLGMDDGKFPRSDLRCGYDLMNRPRRRCDRSRRIDDRYMFLEALLAARSCFCVSYCGRDTGTNQVQPPSVLVAELLDHVKTYYEPSGSAAETNDLPLVTEHKLQAFHPDYFASGKNNKLFSYSESNRRGACALISKPEQELFLATGAGTELLPELTESEGFSQIDINELIAFYRHPARYLIQKRLKIYLDDNEENVTDNEPLDNPDELIKYQWNSLILEAVLQGKNAAQCYRLLKAAGILPPGATGSMLVNTQFREISDLCNRTVGCNGYLLKELLLSRSETVEHDISFPECNTTLTGITKTAPATEHIRERYASVKPKDRLAGFIEQLALAVTRENKQKVIIAGKDMWVELPSVEPELAREQLLRLLTFYRQGLRRPLPFIPELSWEVFANQEKPAKIESAVKGKWQGGFAVPALSRDPYYRRCFGELGPHQHPETREEFALLALKIFQPFTEEIAEKW